MIQPKCARCRVKLTTENAHVRADGSAAYCKPCMAGAPLPPKPPKKERVLMPGRALSTGRTVLTELSGQKAEEVLRYRKSPKPPREPKPAKPLPEGPAWSALVLTRLGEIQALEERLTRQEVLDLMDQGHGMPVHDTRFMGGSLWAFAPDRCSGPLLMVTDLGVPIFGPVLIVHALGGRRITPALRELAERVIREGGRRPHELRDVCRNKPDPRPRPVAEAKTNVERD